MLHHQPGCNGVLRPERLLTDEEYRAFLTCADKPLEIAKLQDAARPLEERAQWVGGPELDALLGEVRRLKRERDRLLDELSRSSWLSDVHRFLVGNLHREERSHEYDYSGGARIGRIRRQLDIVNLAQSMARDRVMAAEQERERLASMSAA